MTAAMEVKPNAARAGRFCIEQEKPDEPQKDTKYHKGLGFRVFPLCHFVAFVVMFLIIRKRRAH